jgi:hypothetical protein
VEHTNSASNIDNIVSHPEVFGVGDRGKQLRTPFTAVLLFKIIVCLSAERVQVGVHRDGIL